MSAGLVLLLSGPALLGCGGDDDGTEDGAVPRDGGGAVDGGDIVDATVGIDAPATLDAATALDATVGDGGISFACTLEELTPIAECARDNCLSLPDGGFTLPDGGLSLPDGGFSLPDASLPDPAELATCILTSCGVLLLSVSPGCRDCLIAGVGMNVDEIAMRCASGLPVP